MTVGYEEWLAITRETLMASLTPLERLQESALNIWADKESFYDQGLGRSADTKRLTDREPSYTNRVSLSQGPLLILRLEESDRLWFKFGGMSLNLWKVWVSSVESVPITKLEAGVEVVNGRVSKQICKIWKPIGCHRVHVESSLVYESRGRILFSSRTQIFVDGILAGEAVMEGTKGGVPGTGGRHLSPPAYVSIGGVLLGVVAPVFYYSVNSLQWVLAPPRIGIWLETTKDELAAISYATHEYQDGSFTPKALEWPYWALEKEKSPDPYVRVPIAIEKIEQLILQSPP